MRGDFGSPDVTGYIGLPATAARADRNARGDQNTSIVFSPGKLPEVPEGGAVE
jgi:hypothetical protein